VSNSVRVFAPAKINLFLHVGEKRPDGYHDLQSLVVFAGVGDALSISPATGLHISIEGPFARQLAGEGDNLVLRAARALGAHAGVAGGARIELIKNVPVASGIGGGSADAAATLRGLNNLWNLGLESDELREIAIGLGSDIPVCIDSGPAWMEGRGETLTPLGAMPEFAMLLVNPGVAVSTADVFRGLRRRTGTDLTRPSGGFSSTSQMLDFLHATANDLEAPACAIQPVIAEVLRDLRKTANVLFARMSGSGATCFALYESRDQATGAAMGLRTRHPHWWVAV
jgi:4-diphosphocytidyl-2-C-methyl-D-erythritol kinase